MYQLQTLMVFDLLYDVSLHLINTQNQTNMFMLFKFAHLK